MKVLDLFSGIGGFSLAARSAGWETVAFCEKDEFCQKVLKKHWPLVPIFDDIKALKGEQISGAIDLICGGFPCQPYSLAGEQRGENDDRHLWPEMVRIISELRPRWVVAENVPGIISMGLDNALADLEKQGYSTGTLVIPACAVQASHRRDRVWIIAHRQSNGRNKRRLPFRKEKAQPHAQVVFKNALSPNTHRSRKQQSQRGQQKSGKWFNHPTQGVMGNATGTRRGAKHVSPFKEKQRQELNTKRLDDNGSRWTEASIESGVCRSLDGVSPWVDRSVKIPNRNKRVKALGNAIVHQVVLQIFLFINKIEAGAI